MTTGSDDAPGEPPERPIDALEDVTVRMLLDLRRSWLLVIACCLLGVAGGVARAATSPDRYRATATLLFRSPPLDQQLFGARFVFTPTDPAQVQATNYALLTNRRIARLTAAELGAPEAEIAQAVTVAANGASTAFDVTGEAGSGERAATLAQTYATRFVVDRRAQEQGRTREAINLLDRMLRELAGPARQGAEAERIRTRITDLEVLTELQANNAVLVASPVASSARASPRPVRAASFGGVIGMVVGILMARLRAGWLRRSRRHSP